MGVAPNARRRNIGAQQSRRKARTVTMTKTKPATATAQHQNNIVATNACLLMIRYLLIGSSVCCALPIVNWWCCVHKKLVIKRVYQIIYMCDALLFQINSKIHLFSRTDFFFFFFSIPFRFRIAALEVATKYRLMHIIIIVVGNKRQMWRIIVLHNNQHLNSS